MVKKFNRTIDFTKKLLSNNIESHIGHLVQLASQYTFYEAF